MKRNPIFSAACREDTGSHFLDSGGAYGRHHERPAIPSEAPAVTLELYPARPNRNVESYGPAIWPAEVLPTIETAAFLSAALLPDVELIRELETYAETTDKDWFTVGRDFMLSQGWYLQAKDNTYNGENDLSQDYVWEVWTRDEQPSDWIYSNDPDDSRCVVYVHTGCDVRGGYGRPIPCGSESDYAVPMDLCAGFSIQASSP